MTVNKRSLVLALVIAACDAAEEPAPAARPETPVVAPEKPEEPVKPVKPGWDDLSLKVAGVARLQQGDAPEQAVLDQRRALVEAALGPLTQCLQQSRAAADARPESFELLFGTDAEGRVRAVCKVDGVDDEELGACLREAVGDAVAPAADERVPVDVSVLVLIELPR